VALAADGASLESATVVHSPRKPRPNPDLHLRPK
jgi:hypothetical protein